MKTGLKEMKKEYKKVDIDQIEVRKCITKYCSDAVYRGYYTAARRYVWWPTSIIWLLFYLRVVKTKNIVLIREDKSHIFKPPCNVLFII
jgi:hypothetical protein